MKILDSIAKTFGYSPISANSGSSKRSFSAGATNRLTSDWAIQNLSIDTDLRRGLKAMRARSRDLARNNPYVRRFVNLMVKNVVGPHGYILKPMPVNGYDQDGRAVFDKIAIGKITQAFADWSKPENCDVTGKHSLTALEQVILKTWIIHGECFVRLVKNYDNAHGFALQLLPTDCVDENYNQIEPNGNEIRMGVEVDKWQKPVAYWVLTRDPVDYIGSGFAENFGRRDRIPATEIRHLFFQEEPMQTRGIPWIFAAMVNLKHLGGYTEAEVIAARVGACKMIFFEQDKDTANEYTGDAQDDAGHQLSDMEPGGQEVLPPGMSAVPFNADHPNAGFDQFVNAMLRGVAMASDVAYHSLTGDLSSVNYSTARVGLLDERDSYINLQERFAEMLKTPVYQAWLPESMLRGQLSLPFTRLEKFQPHKWRGRRWQWIDPAKEASAAQQMIELGLKSRQQIADESDLESFEETIAELDSEKKALEKAGLPWNMTFQSSKVSAKTEKPSDTTESVASENKS
jgi:lambda family phage portal protein